MRLINENGTTNEQLVELANRYGISITRETVYPEANALFQEKWRQKELLDAYQITREPARDADLPLLQALGCVNAVPPPTIEEDYAWGPMEFSQIKMQKGYLLMGSTSENTVTRRLQFVIDHYMVHLDQKPIYAIPRLFYLLGGTHASKQFPKKTEIEMMQAVWNKLSVPVALYVIPVNTPMQPRDPIDLKSEQRPPNTFDTTNHWLLQEQKPGYYLVGSSQPYIQHQTLVVERAHEELLNQRKITFPCYFKGCGPTTISTLPLTTYLDTLAKQFYEETFLQRWWKGIIKSWQEDSPMMRCGDIVAQGRTWWSARGKMLHNIRRANNLHVSPGGYAGPFNTKAEAEAARV